MSDESERLIELLGGRVEAALQPEVDYLTGKGFTVHLAYYWPGGDGSVAYAWIPREQLEDAKALGYRGLIFLQDNKWARIRLRGKDFRLPAG